MGPPAAASPSSPLLIIWRTPFLRASCLALFLGGIGVSMTMPQMTLYLVDELHLSVAVAGLYYLVNLVAPIAGFALGSLSDRLRDRLVLYRCCVVFSACGWVAMAFATQAWMPFVIGAVVLSVGGGSMGQLFAAARDHLTAHPTPVDSRVIAWIRTSFSAGWIVGPILGSWFGATFGLRPMLLATAAILLAEMIPLGLQRVSRVAVRQPHPVTAATSARTARARDVGMLPLVLFVICCVLLMNGDTMKFAYLPLYMDNQLHLSDALRGTVISVQPLIELGLMPLFARLADRIGAIQVLAIGGALGVLANIAYATSSHVLGLFAGQVLMSGLWAAAAGLGFTIAQQLSPHRIGLASSMFSSALPLGGAVGGALGSVGVVWLGIPHLFFVPATLTALGAIGLLVIARRYRPDDAVFADP